MLRAYGGPYSAALRAVAFHRLTLTPCRVVVMPSWRYGLELERISSLFTIPTACYGNGTRVPDKL